MGPKGEIMSILHMETDKINKNIDFPKFIKIAKDVTNDKNYSTVSICKSLYS